MAFSTKKNIGFTQAVLLIGLIGSTAGADEQNNILIKQVLPERGQAIVQTNSSVNVGSELIATFKDGKQCPLKVLKSNGNLSTIDTSTCKAANDLVAGQSLELSLFENDHQSAEPTQRPIPGKAPVYFQEYERDLTDIQYQPPAGKSVVLIQYSKSLATNVYNITNSGSTLNNQSLSTETYNALYGYGFSKYFGAGLGFGYAPTSISTNAYGAGSSLSGQTLSYNSMGITNPFLQIQHRLEEQDDSAFNTDLILSYSPNIGTANSATTKTTGNTTRGGDLTTLGFAFGRKFPKVAYSIGIGFQMYGASTSTNPDTNVQSQSNTRNQFNFSSSIQWRTNERLSILGAVYSGNFSSSTSSTPGSSTVTINNFNQTALELAALFSIVPNQYVIKLDYQNAFQTAITGTVGSTGINGTTSSSLYGLSLLTEF